MWRSRGELHITSLFLGKGISGQLIRRAIAAPNRGWVATRGHIPLQDSNLFFLRECRIIVIPIAGGENMGICLCDCNLLVSLMRQSGAGSWGLLLLESVHFVTGAARCCAWLTQWVQIGVARDLVRRFGEVDLLLGAAWKRIDETWLLAWLVFLVKTLLHIHIERDRASRRCLRNLLLVQSSWQNSSCSYVALHGCRNLLGVRATAVLRQVLLDCAILVNRAQQFVNFCFLGQLGRNLYYRVLIALYVLKLRSNDRLQEMLLVVILVNLSW